jgi:hypothetical protein
VPAWFITEALCVHDGWHYRLARRGDRTVYVFRGQRFARTWKTWSNGEAGWHTVNAYAGGMQFLLSTWNRAGRPYAASLAQAAGKIPYEQIRRAFVITRQDHGSWHEWPNTSRACGLS